MNLRLKENGSAFSLDGVQFAVAEVDDGLFGK